MRPDATATSPLDRALWAILAVVLLAVVGYGGYRLATRVPVARLPVISELPAFHLTASDGREVTAESLRGELWVVDFIFTRCSGICPVLSSTMAALRAELDAAGMGDVKLVSISVDPSFDTPEVLASYAERFAADGTSWVFLTGERDELYRLIGSGFRLSVAEAPPGAEVDVGEIITHSDRLVVVDEALRIRSYRHGTEPDVVADVLSDVHALRRR